MCRTKLDGTKGVDNLRKNVLFTPQSSLNFDPDETHKKKGDYFFLK